MKRPVLEFQELGLRSVITLVYRALGYVRTLTRRLPENFILKKFCVCVCVVCPYGVPEGRNIAKETRHIPKKSDNLTC